MNNEIVKNNIIALESGASFSSYDQEVISMIKAALQKFPEKKIDVRVVGGWVRDHLLGIPNNDIDIAVDGISCEEFGLAIKSLTETNSIVHMKATHTDGTSLPILRVGGGKNIEFDITEYGTGTALDDAKRRDFTINALFFNISTMKVEDLVGGIDDLVNKRIRMPIDPVKSVLEDPRRVLRCFRFAARFDFDVDPELLSAISQNVDFFVQNTSKGRIGLELHKTMSSDDLGRVIDLIAQTGMFNAIFDPEQTINFDVGAAVERVKRLPRGIPPEVRLILLTAAIYMPLYNPDPNAPTIQATLKKLFLPNEVGFRAKKFQRSAALADALVPVNRLNVGRMILDCGEHWRFFQFLVQTPQGAEHIAKNILPFVERKDGRRMEDETDHVRCRSLSCAWTEAGPTDEGTTR